MKSNIKFLLIILGVIITSLYYFPFVFKPFDFVNTKQFLAVIGLGILGIRLAGGKSLGNGLVNKDFFWLTIYAIIVSLTGLFSVTLNGTPDYAYAGYIMSFWVWMGGAYAVYSWIKLVHKDCSISIISNYIIAVCVIQCILALWIDFSPSLKVFIDSYVEQDQEFLNSHRVERLYGIGASLDTAGTRFSIALILISYIVFALEKTAQKKYLPLYLISFAIITIIGNMVARTTLVGVVIGLGYLLFASWDRGFHISDKAQSVWKWVALALLISIPIASYFYYNNEVVHKNIRFAFEGFFSLYEKGKWEVSSNEKLATMYVFPDNLKTWIIGDGYFSSPRDTDPYFTGEIVGGYYMGTDVGYLRFIFYFGLIGLIFFVNFLWQTCKTCFSRFKGTTALFVMLLLANFVIWFKVATDLFLVFALFLCLGKEENDEYMKNITIQKEGTND